MNKNLLDENPELAATWDYEKNAPLLPEHVSPNSRRSVWWICPSGHSWQAPVHRRSKGAGCPYDAGILRL
jgi:hypothetical protein